MMLHCTGLKCHLLNTQNTLLLRTLSPVSFFVLVDIQVLDLLKGDVSAVAHEVLSITGGEEVEPKKRTRADD